MVEELDRICANCSYFFTDVNNLESDFGVCMNDDAFDEYADEIYEHSDFSSCIDLYKEKSFDGMREVCADYEQIEFDEDEFDEDEELGSESQMTYEELDRRAEVYRTQDVGDIAKYLYNDEEYRNKAVSLLLHLMIYKNENAFNAMLDYYKNLPSVETIDDVHLRLNILDNFYHFKPNESCSNDLIDMLIGELYKMDSNNTTRQLFTSILDFLSSSKCEFSIVYEKLIWLLDNRKFRPKMEQNILSVIKRHEERERYEALHRERFW